MCTFGNIKLLSERIAARFYINTKEMNIYPKPSSEYINGINMSGFLRKLSKRNSWVKFFMQIVHKSIKSITRTEAVS